MLLRLALPAMAALLAFAQSSPAWSQVQSSFTPEGVESFTRIEINRLYDGSTTTQLPTAIKLSNLALTADIKLDLPTSIVRVLLIDNKEIPHLIYEAYPLLNGSNQVNVVNACEETCAMAPVTATKLAVQVVQATANIKHLSWGMPKEGMESQGKALKLAQDLFKVRELNQNIKSAGLRWQAGMTSIGSKSYAEKKILFGALEFLPPLQGFEYYKDGIFDLAPGTPVPDSIKAVPFDPDAPLPKSTYNKGTYLPESWDWRAAHGENWVTPVKNQASCGSCWAFGLLGSLESVINLYYNQHLDLDLSEQDLVSCTRIGGCSGALPSRAADYVLANGITDEACFSYRAREVSCSYKCSDWRDRSWKISSFSVPETSDTNFQSTIYNYGPFAFGIYSWSHEMVVVGYQPNKLASGEVAGTQWIIKNSWGENWGNNGYTTMTVSRNDRGWNVYSEVPFFVSDRESIEIACNDKDNDGFCYWGLSGERAHSCPATCQEQKDCDDSDSTVGACPSGT